MFAGNLPQPIPSNRSPSLLAKKKTGMPGHAGPLEIHNYYFFGAGCLAITLSSIFL
jgi:hypothetical protein